MARTERARRACLLVLTALVVVACTDERPADVGDVVAELEASFGPSQLSKGVADYYADLYGPEFGDDARFMSVDELGLVFVVSNDDGFGSDDADRLRDAARQQDPFSAAEVVVHEGVAIILTGKGPLDAVSDALGG